MSDLESDLRVLEAAGDPELNEYYHLLIHGRTGVLGDTTQEALQRFHPEQVLTDVQHRHGLAGDELRRARARCIANLAGVSMGEEVFSDQA